MNLNTSHEKLTTTWHTFLPLTKKVISSLAEEGILSLKLALHDYKLYMHVWIQHRPIVNNYALTMQVSKVPVPLQISATNPWNVSLSLFGKKRE